MEGSLQIPMFRNQLLKECGFKSVTTLAAQAPPAWSPPPRKRLPCCWKLQKALRTRTPAYGCCYTCHELGIQLKGVAGEAHARNAKRIKEKGNAQAAPGLLECNARKASSATAVVAATSALLLSLCTIHSAAATPALALVDAAEVEVVFRNSCAGCHAGGGNILQPNASLSTEDLQRNSLYDTESLYRIIYSGQGRMPGYGEGCEPKGKCTFGPRLPNEVIEELAKYVLKQASSSWN